MRKNESTQEMLRKARELARHGHGIPMIEVMLEAGGSSETYRLLDQPNVQNELLDLAHRARKGELETAEEPRLSSAETS